MLAALACVTAAPELSLPPVCSSLPAPLRATPALPQIVWAMLFHLFRFSIFMLVVMASFALAFHSLFSHPNCTAEDDLYEAYRTLHDSLLRMFQAMLGGMLPAVQIFRLNVTLHNLEICSRPRYTYWLHSVFFDR